MNSSILLKGVTKTFAHTPAVQDLDLDIPRGALYGFIGPNGAGKTTTIRMIMSIIFPDSGEISILGRPSALDAKDRIGYLPEERGVYRRMKVGGFMTYMARLKGVSDANLGKRIRESLERVALGATENKKCEELSKGMLQKVQLLAAIIHEPDLLILDEPFSGLDPVSAKLLRDLVLAEHRRGATILFSTHVMPHAEEICQNVVMIYKGRKVLDEPLSAIRSQYDPRAIQFEPLDPKADVSSLKALPGVVDIERIETGYEIRLAEGTDPATAMRSITMAVAPARVELSRPRLEDVFIRIVSGGTATAETEEKLRADLRINAKAAAV
jgi:ABC-2 type transport system ATP-binding protein